tara:strand:+ start:1102 stop:1251 length:150 start_codon:yes stop_codon:yes gene_type:complete
MLVVSGATVLVVDAGSGTDVDFTSGAEEYVDVTGGGAKLLFTISRIVPI